MQHGIMEYTRKRPNWWYEWAEGLQDNCEASGGCFFFLAALDENQTHYFVIGHGRQGRAAVGGSIPHSLLPQDLHFGLQHTSGLTTYKHIHTELCFGWAGIANKANGHSTNIMPLH